MLTFDEKTDGKRNQAIALVHDDRGKSRQILYLCPFPPLINNQNPNQNQTRAVPTLWAGPSSSNANGSSSSNVSNVSNSNQQKSLFDRMGGIDFFRGGREGQRIRKKELLKIQQLLAVMEEFESGEMDETDADEFEKELSSLSVYARRKISDGQKDVNGKLGNEFLVTDPRWKVSPLPAFDVTVDEKAKSGGLRGQSDRKLENGFRDTFLLSGPSGCGKTSMAVTIINAWQHLNDGPIWVLSRLADDPKIDEGIGPRKAQRIKLDETFLANPPTPTSLLTDSPLGGTAGPKSSSSTQSLNQDAIVLFDDVSTVSSNAILKAVEKLRNDLLETGRHQNITVIVTNHELLDYHHTKKAISESRNLILYPRSSGRASIRQYLRIKVGMDKGMLKKVMDLNSHWILVHKHHPMYVLHENGCMIVRDIDE